MSTVHDCKCEYKTSKMALETLVLVMTSMETRRGSYVMLEYEWVYRPSLYKSYPIRLLHICGQQLPWQGARHYYHTLHHTALTCWHDCAGSSLKYLPWHTIKSSYWWDSLYSIYMKCVDIIHVYVINWASQAQIVYCWGSSWLDQFREHLQNFLYFFGWEVCHFLVFIEIKI